MNASYIIKVPDPENYRAGQRLNAECFVVWVNTATSEIAWAGSAQVEEPHYKPANRWR